MLKNSKSRLTATNPLADVSNGAKPSRSLKKKSPSGGVAGGDLDHLLLVRSELSNLLGQIDELVAQALGNKKIDKKASQEIDSFRNALSDMHSSLKPWVPRLQHAFANTLATGENQHTQTIKPTSISCVNENEVGNSFYRENEIELDSAISPSPLVSWRGGSCADACMLNTGRQLFLLTPLPKSKVAPSKSKVRTFHDGNQHGDKLELPQASTLPNSARDFLLKKTRNTCTSAINFASPLKCESKKDSVLISTPFLKNSPPNNSSLLNDSKSTDDLSSDDVLHGLTSRYQDLLGLHPDNKLTNRRKEGINLTLDWFLSPPKTCVLMEPTEEKAAPTPINNGVLMLATPLWKDAGSTCYKGKRRGESTLKKELWVRFNEASKDGLHFDKSVFQKTERKGFLDMLEEVYEGSGLDCASEK